VKSLDTERKELKPRLWHAPADFEVTKCLPDRRLHRYREEAVYILGLIHWQKAMRFGRLRKKQRIAPIRLKAAYLREVLGKTHYGAIMAALKATGAIVCDGVAWRGQRCYGYDLGPLFSRKFRDVFLTKPKILKAMRRRDRTAYEDLPTLDQHLFLNLRRIQLDDAAWNAATLTRDIDSTEMMLRKIEAGEWFYRIDPFSRRHTNITNLHKSLRKYLTVDGQHLISLDVSASQPLILAIKIAATNDLGGGCVSRATAVWPANASHVRRRPSNSYRSSSGGPPTPFTMPETPDMERSGTAAFLHDAERGVLYEKLARDIGGTRNEAKVMWLKIMYYDPKKWKNRSLPAEMRKIIDAANNRYPGVIAAIEKMKERDYRKLSHDIQRSEAEVMYNMICNSIHQQRPAMFIATIHDCILCKPEDAAFVRKVMDGQFRTLGVQPKIKVTRL